MRTCCWPFRSGRDLRNAPPARCSRISPDKPSPASIGRRRRRGERAAMDSSRCRIAAPPSPTRRSIGSAKTSLSEPGTARHQRASRAPRQRPHRSRTRLPVAGFHGRGRLGVVPRSPRTVSFASSVSPAIRAPSPPRRRSICLAEPPRGDITNSGPATSACSTRRSWTDRAFMGHGRSPTHISSRSRSPATGTSSRSIGPCRSRRCVAQRPSTSRFPDERPDAVAWHRRRQAASCR